MDHFGCGKYHARSVTNIYLECAKAPKLQCILTDDREILLERDMHY